jgi:hypothetical protein
MPKRKAHIFAKNVLTKRKKQKNLHISKKSSTFAADLGMKQDL